MKISNKMPPKTEIELDEYHRLLAELEQTRQKLEFTESKLLEAQEKLQKAQEEASTIDGHLRTLLNVIPLALQVWSDDRTMLYASRESAKLFQFESTQDFIDSFFSIFPKTQPDGEDSLELVHKYVEESFQKGYVQKNFLHINTKGEEVPTLVTFVPSQRHNEKLLFVFLQDLREQNEIIRKLKESQDYSKMMLDSIPMGTMIWNENFIPVDCNKAMARAFGLDSRQEFLENLNRLYPEYQPEGISSLEKMKIHLYKALTEGYASNAWMGLSMDGKEVPTEATAVRTRYNEQNFIVVFYKDLREVEKNIRKAQAAEKRTQAILNGVPLGINMLTANIEILDCNDEAVRMSGFGDKGEYLAKIMQCFPAQQPCGKESGLFLQEKFAEVAEKGHSRFELATFGSENNDIPTDVTLVRSFIENEDTYIAYVSDLRETKAMLREIELAKNAAEKNAMAKSEFLANMSHEIRTPMNGILGLLHILSGTKLDSMQQDYMKKALFSTNELLRIINDILDFSKIEAGKLDMEVTLFTIHDVCTEIQNLFTDTVKQKNLYLQINEGENATTLLLGDPLRLKQVLINLIGNAIKFTATGGITLNIESSIQNDNDAFYRFAITDTGIGLTQEQSLGLFTAFSQADTSVTRKYGGTGLGLAISKRIVELMQGEIWVESAPEQGSTFYFTAYFSISDATLESAPLQITEVQHIENKQPNAHLLLVEDNQINQIIAEELLKQVGYTLDIANNGQEALDMLETKHYDLVFMDIQMPIMDGLTATQKIRENPKFTKLPIIAMSAHAMTGDKEKSLKTGMNDHITKPISPDVLYNTLTYWLNNR